MVRLSRVRVPKRLFPVQGLFCRPFSAKYTPPPLSEFLKRCRETAPGRLYIPYMYLIPLNEFQISIIKVSVAEFIKVSIVYPIHYDAHKLSRWAL